MSPTARENEKMMSTPDTAHRLIEMASTRFGVAQAELRADADFFEQLGINSLQALELLTDVEMAFDVEIPDYELQGVTTFSELATAIDARR